MYRKLLAIIALFAAFTTTMTAQRLKFEEGKRYHIVCAQFPQGCVTDGATAGQNTPLYHQAQRTNADETYWEFVGAGDACLIKNVKTGKYITYDGVRQDSPQLLRYVSMTDDPGNSAYWYIFLQDGDIFTIRNAEHYEQLWDVRVDSYCVGTYNNSNAGNQNQQFFFLDENGNRVPARAANDTGNGFDVSLWMDATAESPDGWTFVGDAWTDPGFGTYSNNAAWVYSPFLERWHSQWEGGLYDGKLMQTLKNLPAGNYTLTADVMAVLQGWNASDFGTPAEGVFLFGNNENAKCSTGSERPETYSVNVTIGEEGIMELGISIENTTANWVACDNFRLLFNGTEEQMLEGEKNKVRKELADFFTASEIEARIAATNDDFYALEELRSSTKTMAGIDPMTKALRNLHVDDHALVYVESLDLYLCTIPLEKFDKDYQARIDYEQREGSSLLSIDGKQVEPGTNYNFKKVEAEKTYKFSMKMADGTFVEKNVTFTSLPVVKLYGSFNNSYQPGSIIVHEPNKPAPQLLNMKAKWRGGITNGSSKHKRNYHVKLLDENGEKLEQKFFGLRNDNSWILESCQVDMSRIRNRILTDLWNDYSVKPYYIDQEPKAMTGTRGRFVELILNDEYRGIYCMTENLDRKQMKLKKYDETTGEVHGQLWKSKDWSYGVFMGHDSDRANYSLTRHPSNYDNRSEAWENYNVKYPDMDDVYPTDWEVLYNAVDFVCTANDTKFKEQFSEYFDLPLVIDYYILMETILSTDNHGKNMFFATYDKQQDKKITFSVWDMDATSGQRWSDDYYHQSFLGPEQDYATFITRYEHGDYNLFRRLRNTNTEDFNMQVRLRYRDLRQTYLATDAIIKRFENQLNEFKVCGADEREYAKWSYDTDVSRRELNFDTEMEYLRDWFTRRMEYLDTKRFDIASLPSGIKGVQTEPESTNIAIYTLGGQKVANATRANAKDVLGTLPSGVYIVDGRKVIVGK